MINLGIPKAVTDKVQEVAGAIRTILGPIKYREVGWTPTSAAADFYDYEFHLPGQYGQVRIHCTVATYRRVETNEEVRAGKPFTFHVVTFIPVSSRNYRIVVDPQTEPDRFLREVVRRLVRAKPDELDEAELKLAVALKSTHP